MSWDRSDLLAVFPFPHTLQLDARLSGSALTVQTTLRATADVAVPVSFGYHPYLTIPGSERANWTVRLPAASRLSLDEHMIPTGASDAVPAQSFELGDAGWDDAFAQLPATPRFSASEQSRTIEIEFLHGYDFAQVFTQPGASFVCFEPMTAPTNALLSGRGLTRVAPGEEFRAAFRVSMAGWR
jgi:galactose mutarotase-like enzyme